MLSFLSAFSPWHNLKLLFVRPRANLAALDGLRALSMLMILCYHCFAIFAVLNPTIISLPDLVETCGWTWAWVWNLDKSVDIFLVLSGFLIAGMLFRQVDDTGTIGMKRFYWNRFLRLSPVYYFAIGLYVWVCMAGNVTGAHLDKLWANVLYVNNFLPYEDMAMNWTWSLAVEEQFYLVFPLFLLWIAARNGTQGALPMLVKAFLLSFVICFVVIMTDDVIRTTPGSAIVRDHHLHAHHFSVLYDNLYTRYGSIMAGIIAAWFHRYKGDAVQAFFVTAAGRGVVLLACAFITLIMMLPILTTRFDDWQVFAIIYQTATRNLFAAALCVLILLSFGTTLLGRGLRAVLGSRVWYPIAQLSYSMYLVHVLVVTVMASIAGQAMKTYPERYAYTPFEAIGIVYVASLVFTVLIAMVMYLMVERPIMNLRK